MIHRWLLTLQNTALPDHISQKTGKSSWAWCEVILITPRSWLCTSWVLQKLTLSWPELDQVSPPWLSYWWHYSPNSVQPEIYHLGWGNSISFTWILTVYPFSTAFQPSFPIQWSMPAFESISSFSWPEMHASVCCVFTRALKYLHNDVVVQLAKLLFSSQFIRNMRTNCSQ